MTQHDTDETIGSGEADTRNPATIVLAAGSGRRFGARKQYLDIAAGVRLVDRAVEVATSMSSWVTLVLPPEATWDGAAVDAVVAGGVDRLASVRTGLATLPETCSIVVVHDAAHPLASPDLFQRGIDAVARGADGAVPVLVTVDVIKHQQSDGSLVTVGREGLGAAQVPMTFDRRLLEAAHRALDTWDADRRGAPRPVEDSELMEALGHVVVGVPGEARNVHVVDVESLEIARLIENAERPVF